MTRLPIRIRLTLAFALVMALVLAGLGMFLYLRLGDSLDERIADELESRSAALATGVRTGQAAGLEPSLFRSEEGVAQVLGPDGEGLFPSSDPLLRAEELETARRGSLTIERGGLRLRADPVGDSVVVVGESLEDRDEALEALLTQLLVALPLALLGASFVGYVVAGAALRPVETMRAEAEAISESEPDRRLPLPAADDEIRRLGETLNEMLDRLELALERERTFVADASHELRTPLAALRTELELALRRPRTQEELVRAVRSAAAETDRLVRLAEDLLLVARADRGRLPVRPAPLDVATVLSQVAGRFERRARDAGRAIETSAEPGLELRADPARVEQALGNLVDNALRHGGGTVRLSARERDGVVELHVVDEGPGFRSDFLPRAFERFSRDDEARTRGGTGLGLAIVEVVATAHGGSAHAMNRESGGADVWVSVPKVE